MQNLKKKNASLVRKVGGVNAVGSQEGLEPAGRDIVYLDCVT
jgi:hypothetical protein